METAKLFVTAAAGNMRNVLGQAKAADNFDRVSKSERPVW